MRPLWFLTCRTFVNGVRRALGSPRRLIGLLFFSAYYLYFFVGPALMSGRPMHIPGGIQGSLDFPPMVVIDALAFGVLSALSLFMMLGVFSGSGGFKPADVDVLFPTPISPKTVLVFRMVRDYLITLVLPLFVILVGLRPAAMGWQALFRNMPNPGYSGMTIRALGISWILMAMCWVAIHYAVGLFVNRSDARSTRYRKLLVRGMGGILLAASLYIGYEIRNLTSVGGLLDLASSPVLRSVFFTATLATKATLAPLRASWMDGALGLGGLVAIMVFAVRAAVSQIGWMYDQAAVKGFETAGARAAQRRGDTLGAIALMAKSGRVKAGRRTFIHRLKLQGPLALVWKEFFLQTRGQFALQMLMVLMGVGFNLMAALVKPGQGDPAMPVMFVIMQASTVFMVTLAMSQIGFIEVLRRVDLQKPMPFTPAKITAYEVVSRALLGTAVAYAGAIVAVAFNPSLLLYAAGCLVLMPSLSFMLSATVCLVTMLFPDFDDPSQRQFRALMLMLALVLVGLLPAFAFVALWFLGVPFLVTGLVTAAVCVAAGLLATTVSGALYASFNPSE